MPGRTSRSFARDLRMVLVGTSVAPLLAVVVATLVVSGGLGVAALPIAVVTLVAVGAAAWLAWRLSDALVRPFADLANTLSAGSEAGLPTSAAAAVRTSDPVEVVEVKRALVRLLDRVEDETRARATITASITHDLRTPLIAAVRTIDAMPAPDPVPAGYRDGIENARAAVDEALVLSSMLLDVQRYGIRTEPLRMEEIDLVRVVDAVVERVAPDASRRGVTVSSAGVGTALANQVAARRAVANLVENAVRHARRDVSVTVFPGLVRVTDDGAGLDAALDSVSAPFVGSAHAGVAGLGMYIVRQIADLHGGRLVVERTSDTGTVLLLYLPAGA